MSPTLQGLYPSAVRPVHADLSFAYRHFILEVQGFVRMPKVGGVVVNDHAGEVLALDRQQRAEIVRRAREAVPASFTIIAGVQGGSVDELVELGNDAKEHGADVLLVHPLEGNEDPVRYHETVASTVGLPVVAVQAASGEHAYDADTLAKLCSSDMVIGIKSQEPDVEAHRCAYDAIGGAAAVLVAAETESLPDLLAAGAEGAILDVGSMQPRPWSHFVADACTGKADEARMWFDSTGKRLLSTLSGTPEATPALVKEALTQTMFIETSAVVGAPYRDIGNDDEDAITEMLDELGLLLG